MSEENDHEDEKRQGQLNAVYVRHLASRLLETVFVLFAAVLIFSTCFVSAIAVTEIGARITTRSIVEQRLAELNDRVTNTVFANDAFANAMRIAQTDASKEEASKGATSEVIAEKLRATTSSLNNAAETLEEQESEIENLQSILLRLNLLEASGTTTSKVRTWEMGAQNPVVRSEKISLAVIRASLMRISLDHSDNREWMGMITEWSTDLILAIALISAGLLGAVISGLRVAYAESEALSKNSKTGNRLPASWMGSSFVKDIIIGAGAGFMTFLVLKGGKFLFVVEAGGIQVQTNPYGSAFAAVLAGLFTERAYKFLSTLVDQSIDRVSSPSGTEKTVRKHPRRE